MVWKLLRLGGCCAGQRKYPLRRGIAAGFRSEHCHFTRFNRAEIPPPASRNRSAGVPPAVRAASSPPLPSIKFPFWRSLLSSHATGNDLRRKITFTFHRSPRHPPQHRDLSNMRQRIRDRPLKQFFRCGLDWVIGSQKIIESLQTRKEPLDVLIPVLHPRVPPSLLPPCN